MIFEAILRNNNKPGYGQVTVPFPIPDSEYDHTIALLEELMMVSTPFKNVIFRRNGMSFFAGQHTGVYSLNH